MHVHELKFLFERLAADVNPVDIDRSVLSKDLLGIIGLVWNGDPIQLRPSLTYLLNSQLKATSAPNSFK